MIHTTHNSTLLKQRVMRRVYVVWFVREIMPWVALEVAALSGLAILMRAQVAISSVMENTQIVCQLNGVGSCFNYVVYAFTHTNIVVQLATVALAVLLSIIGYDFARSFRRSLVALYESRWIRNLVRF